MSLYGFVGVVGPSWSNQLKSADVWKVLLETLKSQKSTFPPPVQLDRGLKTPFVDWLSKWIGVSVAQPVNVNPGWHCHVACNRPLLAKPIRLLQ